MKATFLAALALSATCCLAAPRWPSGGWGWGHGQKEAVYFLRVDPAGSTIVAVEVGSDGLLTSSTSSTSTGGVGLQSQNASTPALAPTAIDPLQGQQAVSIGGNYLFTINSGSNTAVLFEINPQNPLDLKLVGSPVPTLGQFAMSIAYSSKYEKACVLNGGAVNGVTCFDVSSAGLTPDGVGLREFGFDSTTPAQLGGAKGSGSDIQFSIDSSKLITTFKGDNTPMTLGHISVFDVSADGDVAAEWTDNQISPIYGPFGFALSGSDAKDIFVTDVAYGGALVSLDYETNVISLVSIVNDTSFTASCWAAWSSTTNLYYDINAASPNIGKVDAAGDLVGLIDYNKTLGGATDSVASGSFLYFLTAMNVIAVLDIESGELLQQYEYATADDRPFWTGLAQYPASPLLSGAQ